MRTRVGPIVYVLLLLAALVGISLPWLSTAGGSLHGAYGLGGAVLLTAILLSLAVALAALFVSPLRQYVDQIALALGAVLFGGTLYRFMASFTLIYRDAFARAERDVGREAAEQATAYGFGVPLTLIALNAIILVAIGRIAYRYLRQPD